MQRFSIWSYIVSILVGLFFVANGITTMLAGQYIFSIIWLILTGTFLFRSIQGLVQELHKRKQTNEFESSSYTSAQAPTFVEKQRLEKLEQLYQSGLISKEEYEEKRKSIIKDI